MEKINPEDTTEYFCKNILFPQMAKNRQIINLGNGIVVDTPLPLVIEKMYGYCFCNGKTYKCCTFKNLKCN